MGSRAKKKLSHRDLDEQFDAFMKESMSSEDSSLDSARVARYLKPKNRKKDQPWWMQDEDKSEGGLTGTGRNFLKAKKKEPPAPSPRRPKGIDHKETNHVQSPAAQENDVGMSKDSLDDVPLHGGTPEKANKPSIAIPTLSLGSTASATDTMTGDNKDSTLNLGGDTMAEMADKEKFFKELEKNSSGTIDYSLLNQDLDKSGTMGTLDNVDSRDHGFTKYQHGSDEDSDECEKTGDRITQREREMTNHNHVQEADSQNSPDDSKPGSMLSKVALMDSLDSTLGTKHGSRDTAMTREDDDMKPIPEDREHDTMGTMDTHADNSEEHDMKGTRDNNRHLLKTGTGLGFTDTSREIEALQAALREAGMSTLGTTIDTLHLGTSKTLDMAATQTASATGAFGLQNVAHDSDKPARTVEDILKEVQELHMDHGDSTGAFSQKPAADTADESMLSINQRRMQVPPGHARTDDSRKHNDSCGHLSEGTDQLPPHTAEHAQERAETKHTKPGRKKSKYDNVKSSGYGASSSPQKKKQWTPADTSQQKVKGTEKPEKTQKVQKKAKPKGSGINMTSSVADSHLMASIQSFASYIQQHFTETGPALQSYANEIAKVPNQVAALPVTEREKLLLSELQQWQEQWKEERKIRAKLEVDVATKQQEFDQRMQELKSEHDQEVFKLKQANFVLSAKVSESATDSESRKKVADSGIVEGASREQIDLLEKEIREQEKLIAGYQQENQRLYQEIKTMQQITKHTEEKMFRENQRLTTELVKLRTQLDQKEIEIKNKGLITSPMVQQQIAGGSGSGAVLGAGRIAELEAQLRQARREASGLGEEVKVLTQTKKELEQHIEHLVTKLQQLEERVNQAQGGNSPYAKKLQEKHDQEIEPLREKLRWYAKNQELLDKDAESIKQKDQKIKELTGKVEQLQSEAGQKQFDHKARAKQKSQDAKRIQDLERQVREMEGIIRQRNPNSLPALMWAAAAAPDPEGGKKAPSVSYLEKQVKKLEAELEQKDEEAKKSLRVVEQKYNSMKCQYEERLESLEAELQKYRRPGDLQLAEGQRPHSHAVALEKELASVKDRYKKRIAEVENEAERLRKEVHTLKHKEETASKTELKVSKEREEKSELRVRALQLELTNQEQEKQLLQKTIERLRLEKQQVLTDATRQAEKFTKMTGEKLAKKTGAKRGKAGLKGVTRSTESQGSDTPALLPYSEPHQKHKQYEPDSFSGAHITDVLRENEQLRLKVDHLQLDREHQALRLRKQEAETEGLQRRLQEQAAEQLIEVKTAHQREMQKVLAEHALQHSSSSVAQLQSKVHTQEVVINHLKAQMTRGQVDTEALAALRIREASMETQVKQLQEELKQAKKSYNPERQHFEALKDKIVQLEARHSQRERELQQIIHQSHTLATSDVAAEVDKWRRIVETKNLEIERFRSELDSILQVLRTLQRQGVVLPPHKSTSLL